MLTDGGMAAGRKGEGIAGERSWPASMLVHLCMLHLSHAATEACRSSTHTNTDEDTDTDTDADRDTDRHTYTSRRTRTHKDN